MRLQAIVSAAALFAAAPAIGQDASVLKRLPADHDYWVVVDPETGRVEAEGSAAEVRLKVGESKSQDLLVTATSQAAALRLRVKAPATVDPDWSKSGTEACGQVSGVVRGPTFGRPLYFFSWDVQSEIFGTVPSPDGRFVTCLPRGRYRVSVESDAGRSVPLHIDVILGSPVSNVEVLTVPLQGETQPRFAANGKSKSAEDLPAILAPSARVIGVGESNHGSATFMKWRVDLLLAVASKRSVSIGIEANVAEVFALDDYVLGRRDDVGAVVANNGYWLWNTQEMVAALMRVRSHNRAVPPGGRVIHVIGVDVARIALSIDWLLLHRSELGIADAAVKLLALLKEKHGVAYRAMTAVDRATVDAELERLARMGDGDRGSNSTRAGLAALAIRSRLAVVLAEGLRRSALRDLGMAEMVKRIALDSSELIFYWAHNQHVTFGASVVPSVGAVLKGEYGDGYIAVAQFAFDGSTRAHAPTDEDVSAREMPKASPAMFESGVMRFYRHPVLAIVDLRRPELALAPWVSRPVLVREFGHTMYGGDDDLSAVRLDSAYDVALVVHESGPTHKALVRVDLP